jgi:hypothetical protein
VLKTFSPLRLALFAVCALGLFGCSSNGLIGDAPGGQTGPPPASQPTVHPNGIVQDWSTRSEVFPRVGEINSLIAVQHDPRALLSWQAMEREDWHRARNPRRFVDLPVETSRDWSISLGVGGVAASMYPAKFGFDVTAAPDCANDFVVFPVNATGSATQPNLVAFNQLYSGTAPGPVGICNRAPSGSDTGIAAETFWSYNVKAAGGKVVTSPSPSLDGTKVAFVESGSGVAHFHVLAWKSGDGKDLTNLQNVLLPVTISSFTNPLAPVAGSGTASDLVLGIADDTLSSPFVDYTNDVAYIGNDSGTLFRVKDVFCRATVPVVNPACTGLNPPAPSLDASWGSSGALSVGGTCVGKLSGAVVDGGTGHIFVGCSDGRVYGFTSAGVALANPSAVAGNGTANGGIVDPPMIDAVNGFLYVVSGASGVLGPSVMVQAKTADLSSVVTSTLGIGGSFNLHAPSFSSGYFSSVVPANWLLYDWALNAAGTNIDLYAATFSAGHNMNGGPAADSIAVGGSTAVEFSPTTEFLNGATDQLFVSGLTAASPNFIEYNLTAFAGLFPTSFPPAGATGATATEVNGTSGIVVDNTSASAQASSIYFGTIGANNAVKLTQTGLN